VELLFVVNAEEATRGIRYVAMDRALVVDANGIRCEIAP